VEKRWRQRREVCVCVCVCVCVISSVLFVLYLSGRLVSGDCKKNIHVWEPREGGTSWQIDQRPFSSHSKSVEDLQWSPTEATVCKILTVTLIYSTYVKLQ